MQAAERAKPLSLPEPVKKLVPKKKKGTSKKRALPSFTLFIFLVTFFSSLVMINVCLHAFIAQDSMHIEKLNQRFEKEKLEKERLSLKKTFLTAPKRIEKIAVEKLGMIAPSSINYVIYNTYSHSETVTKTENEKFPQLAAGKSETNPWYHNILVNQVMITSLSSLAQK